MTGPSDSAGLRPAERTRARLVDIGLPEQQILVTQATTPTEFDDNHLLLSSFDDGFTAFVDRIQRLARSGRGLSFAVAGPLAEARARTHAALQIAVGLSRASREVVVADADFSQAGLSGLLADPHQEGMIDMLRFGRSCRGVLHRPIPDGPSLLSVGSFPVSEPQVLDLDSLRSVMHRVSLHCEVALYITPVRMQERTNPLLQACDHVIFVATEGDPAKGDETLGALSGLQHENIHVGGVVLYDRAPVTRIVRPETVVTPPMPGLDEVRREAKPLPASPKGWPTKPEPPEPAAPQAPDRQVSRTPDAAAGLDPGPNTETPVAKAAAEVGAEDDGEIPALELPSQRSSAGRESSSSGTRFGPGESAAAEPEENEVFSLSQRSSQPMGELWPEESETPEAEDNGGPIERSAAEAYAVRDSMRMADTEFGYDEGPRYSRAPLFLLVTLIILIVLFLGWAVWTRNDMQSRVQTGLGDDRPNDTAAQAGQGSHPAPGNAELPESRDGLLFPNDQEAALSVGDTGGDDNTETEPPANGSTTAAGTPAAGKNDTSQDAASTMDATPGQTEVGRPAATDEGMANLHADEPNPVAAETLRTPARPTPPVAAPSGSGGGYTVHVGSYKTIEEAYKDIAGLQQKGFEARTVRTDLGAKGIWYRVYAGEFETRSEAETLKTAILNLPEYKYAQVMRNPRP